MGQWRISRGPRVTSQRWCSESCKACSGSRRTSLRTPPTVMPRFRSVRTSPLRRAVLRLGHSGRSTSCGSDLLDRRIVRSAMRCLRVIGRRSRHREFEPLGSVSADAVDVRALGRVAVAGGVIATAVDHTDDGFDAEVVVAVDDVARNGDAWQLSSRPGHPRRVDAPRSLAGRLLPGRSDEGCVLARRFDAGHVWVPDDGNLRALLVARVRDPPLRLQTSGSS